MLKKRIQQILLITGSILLLGLVISLGISGFVSWELTHPEPSPVTATPEAYDLAFQNIRFDSRVDHLPISGWLIPADSSNHKIVIQAHGYRDNRSSISASLPVAQALQKAGITVLMFDFRAQGNSPGEMVSFGEYEIRDLLGAVDYAKAEGYKKIGVIGYSMGAATAINAAGKDTLIAAVIADSPFANLLRYEEKKMPVWTGLPDFPFTRQVLWLLKNLYGLNPAKVAPDQTVQNWDDRPLLLIAGTADQVVAPANSRLLYEEVKNTPYTDLWIVPEGRHIRSYDVVPQRYQKRVTEFFENHL